MALVLRSLSDFKRFLAKPGATIQIVRNTFIERQPASFQEAYRQKGMYEPRTVQAISKKAAVFAIKGHPSTVWLYWDKGTRNWRYSGDTLAVPLNTGVGPPDEIIYRCSFSPDAEPKARAPARPRTKSTEPKPATPTDQPKPTMPERGQGRLF